MSSRKSTTGKVENLHAHLDRIVCMFWKYLFTCHYLNCFLKEDLNFHAYDIF